MIVSQRVAEWIAYLWSQREYREHRIAKIDSGWTYDGLPRQYFYTDKGTRRLRLMSMPHNRCSITRS